MQRTLCISNRQADCLLRKFKRCERTAALWNASIDPVRYQSAGWKRIGFLQSVKRDCPDCPVILLTANDTDGDIVNGLELGADDYITKPFSLSVLRARVNTQLRKAAAMSEKEKDNEHVYRKEPYVFDFDRMKFMVDGKEIELSKTEQKLLRILVENAGMNMRRELLLDRVWSDGAEYVDENALSVSVKRLRDKLGAEHAIRTVYGIGYRWE